MDAKLPKGTSPQDASAVSVVVTLFTMRGLEVAVARVRYVSFVDAELEVRLLVGVEG